MISIEITNDVLITLMHFTRANFEFILKILDKHLFSSLSTYAFKYEDINKNIRNYIRQFVKYSYMFAKK